MSGWVIYYSDGSRVDGSSYTGWTSAPAEGLLGVVQNFGEDEHGRWLRRVCYGSDWYGMSPDGMLYHGASHETRGCWIMCDLPPEVPDAACKRGIWIDIETWEPIRLEIMKG